MGSAAAVDTARAVDIVRATPVMSVAEDQQLARRQAQESDYYAVYLEDEATGSLVRVRAVVWILDAERNPVLDADGRRQARNPHDVALDVWAAYGADDHTLKSVMRGSQVVATPASIANELAMSQISRQA